VDDTNVHPVRVKGTVNLNGARLVAGPLNVASIGTKFILIDNFGTGPINGTFSGLPEGKLVAVTNEAGGIFFSKISYVGGNGNDVTLEPVALPPHLTGLQPLPSGGFRLTGIATPEATVRIEGTEDFVSFQLLGETTAEESGEFAFDDTPAVAPAKRFYRAFIP
jgi:hypothetical protein